MTNPTPLEPSQLHHHCDPQQFSFQTTAELEDMNEIIGQTRALDAVRFGADIRYDGYNLFVLGPAGLGKRSMVRQMLEKRAKTERPHDDWCYINNFAEPHKPKALRLPPSRGHELRQHMSQLVEYLRAAVPGLFESEEYHAKAEAIQEEFGKRQEQVFKELGGNAEKQNIVLLRTPAGFAFAPAASDQTVMPPDEYQKLPEEERKKIESAISELQERLEKALRGMPQWRKELTERLKQLNRETMMGAVEHQIDDIRTHYTDQPDVQKYLDAVQQDMVEHVDDFKKQEEPQPEMALVTPPPSFHQYEVNVLVGNGIDAGAPIYSEDNPTYGNLIGRVEHAAQFGALVTNFTLIKPGALHRANGGYLMLDVQKVLSQPFAWEGLKRALKAHAIHIESLGQLFSMVSTVSLEPEPIPLDAKIILFGDRIFYYLLQQYDPEFSELFKVAADFEELIDRNDENQQLYARLISTLSRKEKLQPFDRGAVARVIDHSARLVSDSEKLSTHMRSIADLLRESDYWARQAGRDIVCEADVQHTIDTQILRQGRMRDRLHEEILRGTLMIDTKGAVAGQINGLSVMQLGGFAFAAPTRITANVRLGDGELINIEREVKLSGAIHSKGVLIMSSFLAARYAKDQPFALSASLVFEQSYGPIDGDSASMAELCTLLSRLADAPINQSLAMTGSVNQFGESQAIGGVNEKIEGFFDICRGHGLNGENGVLIPVSNVKHLMLRRDVVDAVKAGQFRVIAYENVDQAITALTDMPAGEPDAAGNYPEGSINQRVAARLAELTRLREKFAKPPGKETEAKKEEGKG